MKRSTHLEQFAGWSAREKNTMKVKDFINLLRDSDESLNTELRMPNVILHYTGQRITMREQWIGELSRVHTGLGDV